MVKGRRDKRIWYVVLGVFVAVFLFSFLAQRFSARKDEVSAANLANFDPGYIISDWQMGNYNSMSEVAIQTFLTNKNPCNNTDYNSYVWLTNTYPNVKWRWNNGHFVCISEERFGDGVTIGSGETAAHIIWQAAQDYRINPQVLIVLLQKEQGLITDTYPHSGQYRSATGYGCPDTAPCNAEYYGFKNQVRKAAQMFRTVLDGGWTNYPVGWNYVQYHPDATCGGTWVEIKNRATSALYRYTPYQPNAGALAAGYGTTGYCGAYGNRNFYLYFEDWFGGVTDSRIQWGNMESSRVMTVNSRTLIINAATHNLTNIWLNEGENYYFTRKTLMYLGDGQQVCLQRKIDEGTENCVLMARVSDFSLENNTIKLPNIKEYELTSWTCAVNILNQQAECSIKQYFEGDTLGIEKTTVIDGQEFLIETKKNNGLAILKKKTRIKLYFEDIGPKLMRLKNNSYKYDGEVKNKIQALNTNTNYLIKIIDKTQIDGEIFYRTAADHSGNNNYIIRGTDLSDEIFSDFSLPRNLKIIKATSSINLDTGEKCRSYKKGSIQKYTKKIAYGGIVFFQNIDEKDTHCAVKASELEETGYSVYDFNVGNSFVNFMVPRKLKTKYAMFMVNIENGLTCEDYLEAGDVQLYRTKARIGNIDFYRTEMKTRESSPCSVPANGLIEL